MSMRLIHNFSGTGAPRGLAGREVEGEAEAEIEEVQGTI